MTLSETPPRASSPASSAWLATAFLLSLGCGARDSLQDYQTSEPAVGGREGASGGTSSGGRNSTVSKGGASIVYQGGTPSGGAAMGGAPAGGAAMGGAIGGTLSGGAPAGGSLSGGAAGNGVGGAPAAGTAATAGTAGWSGGNAGMAGAGTAGTAGMAGADTHWRNSLTPLCDSATGSVYMADIWSDPRGVYLLASNETNVPRLLSNRGAGWTTSYTWPPGTNLMAGGITGFVNGPLIVWGNSACAIQTVDGQDVRCSGAAASASDVAVVNSTLAYSVYEDRLLRYDGAFWTQVGEPLEPRGEVYGRALWADATTVVLAANTGRVYLLQGSTAPKLQYGLPEVDFTAAWGTGSANIWIGSAEGQLYHYDGESWSLMGKVPGDCNGIIELWGEGDQLFVLTRSLFGRWNGDDIIEIEGLPCDDSARFYGLWGNSSAEVFVVLADYGASTRGCGPVAVHWYDGQTVRPL